MRRRKGQSILEYVIVLTTIVAAIILAASTFKGNVQTAITNAGTSITTATGLLPGAGGTTP